MVISTHNCNNVDRKLGQLLPNFGPVRRGDIGKTEKRLIGGQSFRTISGGLSVNFECKERIEYEISLSNRGIEGRPRVMWEAAFERRTIFFVSGSVRSKVE
jgi:hypothetical protein